MQDLFETFRLGWGRAPLGSVAFVENKVKKLDLSKENSHVAGGPAGRDNVEI